MLQAIFGKSEEKPSQAPSASPEPVLPVSDGKPFVMSDGEAPPITPGIFDQLFGEARH